MRGLVRSLSAVTTGVLSMGGGGGGGLFSSTATAAMGRPSFGSRRSGEGSVRLSSG